MEQEKKQLLLKDLCARLPYGVIVHNEEGYEGHLNSINQTIFGIELDVNITSTRRVDFQLDTCKPYLRPMSSMTGEECITLSTLMPYVTDAWKHIKTPIPLYIANIEQFDFFHRHHLDWRGLIQKGLALEAPEGMYKTK